MSAQETLLTLKKHLEVWRVPSDKVAVAYQNCEVRDGFFLIAVFGEGDTFEQACEDYLNQLHGKTLVFDSRPIKREEICVL